MKALTISSACPSNPDKDRIILKGLIESNVKTTGLEFQSFSIYLRDKNQNVKGGAGCLVYGSECIVNIFWVDEDHRQKGYGTSIMNEIEQKAIDKGCTKITLTTFDFQARPFYERLGYTCISTIEKHLGPHDMYFMRKDL